MTSKLVGTSSAERTLDQRDLAALRPAVQPKPRQRRSPPVLREVTSGIVCFCGERFGESQALEFMLHLRAEVGTELAVLNRHREGNRRYMAARKVADPEWWRKRVDDSNRRHKKQREAAAADRAKPCACGCGELAKGWGMKGFKPGHGQSKERSPAEKRQMHNAAHARRMQDPAYRAKQAQYRRDLRKKRTQSDMQIGTES